MGDPVAAPFSLCFRENAVLHAEGTMSTGKSKVGREELVARVQQALSLTTKKEAENVIGTVISALEATLLANLATDKFSLKLNSFGKFTVRHKPGIYRKIPFTGETKMTSAKRKVKFVTLGELRKKEAVPNTQENN
jgi:nucleoid DNA-binding protein